MAEKIQIPDTKAGENLDEILISYARPILLKYFKLKANIRKMADEKSPIYKAYTDRKI